MNVDEINFLAEHKHCGKLKILVKTDTNNVLKRCNS